MVVAMVAVRVVQVAVDQVVDVVTVRDGFVAATGAMDVAGMADGRVAAAGAMGVVMVGVMGQLAFAHDDLLSAIDDAIIYP